MRWDQYDDSAGSELSTYLSARFQPTGWLLLRASWGEGFRAGSMNNLYDGTSLWLQTGFDLVKCRRDGIAPSRCVEGEFPTYTGGNRALRPELSESYNLGVVAAWNSLAARARPSDRSSAAIIWRYGNHTVSGRVHYVGGFGLPEAEFSISPHAEFDLFYQWETPRNGRILYASYRHFF